MRSLPSLYLRALSSSGCLNALSKIKMQSLDFAWVVQVSFLRPGPPTYYSSTAHRSSVVIPRAGLPWDRLRRRAVPEDTLLSIH
jgi:hypothetical protein